MRTPLSCESMACPMFLRSPWLKGLSGLCCTFCYSFLTSCGMDESLGLHSLHLISFFGLGLTCIWALFPSVRPLSFFTFSLWVDQCSYHAIPLLLPCYHLTCACWASFGPATYFSLVWALLYLISFLWASSTHFTPLGILGPFRSYIPIGFCYIFWASPAQYPLLSRFIGICTNLIC